MKRVFIDTSAWIAINSKNDQHHDEASFINQKLVVEGYRYITTNFILDETYTFIRQELSHKRAVEFRHEIIKLEEGKKVEIVYVFREIENSAWKIFEQYDDKDFSFTDCTSFVVMEQFGISEAFTFDHHFEEYGFALLRASMEI